MTGEKFTITAALPYANGPVHIGHLAGVYVPADIYVRYLRSRGKDVLFVCGSDEHGVPITIRARKEGASPQKIVDKYHKMIQDSFKEFGISFNIYSRTSGKVHHETASEFFTNLNNKKIFKVISSDQFYDTQAQQFLADRYIIGTCPNCGFEEAYGDQCESCGTSLSPSELKNPRSALSGEKPVLRETKHWYLPLNEYEKWLNEWIVKGHKKDWKTNVYGQCKSWIDQGLQPRAVTRDLDWGVPVPLEDAKGKVLYVWFDAPIGYISATKEWASENNQDWEKYWKDKDRRLLHFIGKDNIVFHCIIFPAMLKAHSEYNLPDNVPANEFLNLEGRKISTSKNWAVWLHEFLVDFPEKQDVLRYTLCANAPETKDNDFTWKDFQARNNSELVAILGNFVNRALVLTHKYFDGVIPPISTKHKVDEEIESQLKSFPRQIEKSLDAFRFREALNIYMELARMGNKYLADTEPWKIKDEEKDRIGTILNLALQIITNLAILGEPFLPQTSGKIFKLLGINMLSWNHAGTSNLLKSGNRINKAELLFEKIEDDAIEFQVNKLKDSDQTNENQETDMIELIPPKAEITYDEFSKMDMRIGQILEAESVPKSNKLLKLKIDTGLDKRIIVSGIAKSYNPKEIIGRKVCILVNLAPRKIMGIESQGMVLMSEDPDGRLAFLQPDKETINGSLIS